ncbi:MAG: translocation/assembly module TamB domain-containing protein, partial [Sulfurovaceae bacterium]|nr:translocation/assembly module TamB domain-containing protein [Sulfurovaceae bacterium]
NRYINSFLEKEKISITNRPKIDISLYGGLRKLTIQTHTQAHIKQNKIISKLTLSTTPIEFDAQNHRIKGSLKLINASKNMGFDIKSRFDGDYTNPKKIKTKTQATIKSFNLFGVNLNPIVPLRLDIENSSLGGAKAIIDSDRIKLHVTSSDYDHIKFNIKTRNLYLYRMIELPDELHHKFVKLDLKGDATISKQYANIEGVINSNKKFKANLDIHNNKLGLNANISTHHLKLKANGNIDKKDIKSQIEIDSLAELQQEINKLYTFKKFDIDGSLKLKAKLNGEKIWTQISSPKLQLDGFNIDGLDIDANYNNKLITLNKFNLKTTGFEDKKLNKEIYLNKKGKIYLGENKKIDIDMHPDIHIIANGNDDKLDGKVTIKQLPLGHPDYGSMFLNCDIDYKQRGLDKSITGNLLMNKMKLFYEAKFLDVDYDPDVMVITKKDKRKELEPKDDSFLNHTKIDISIQAPQARYKTPDIDLLFDINLKADKQFGKDLALLGKIEDINGHFDQVPKRFKIEHSNVVFKGGKKINPILDIKVKYELPQVIIHIDIGGDANRPKLEFSSEPPMPKKDIMSYLLLGVSATDMINGEGSLGREAELFIINQAARDLAYDLDLDKVFVKDDGTGEGYDIEVGKKISKKNMVIIESSKEGNSFILENDINRNIKVRVGQHQKENPSQSIDIYFRKRFK